MPFRSEMQIEAPVTVRTAEMSGSATGVMDLIFFWLEAFSIHILLPVDLRMIAVPLKE